jgi:hypothetical protein
LQIGSNKKQLNQISLDLNHPDVGMVGNHIHMLCGIVNIFYRNKEFTSNKKIYDFSMLIKKNIRTCFAWSTANC